MAKCYDCERTDVKCCPTCARNAYSCNVWHHCGKDCEGYEPRIKSQGDRIRAMSDEEMSTQLFPFLLEVFEDGVPTEECFLEWLKSEVKE